VPVAPVADASFAALLDLQAPSPQRPEPISAGEREAIAHDAQSVRLSDEAIAGLTALRHWLAGRERALSDRRWRQWVALMRVAAASEGRDEVDGLDLWLAPYVAAASPQEVPTLAVWFDNEWLGAAPQLAPWLTRAVQAFERQLEIEQSANDDPDAANAAGKLALARAIAGPGTPDDAGSGMMRIMSARLEAQQRRHYSSVHIAARMAQLDEVLAQARTGRDELAVRDAALAARLTGRLWLPPQLAQRLRSGAAQTLAVLDGLIERLTRARQGYAELPLDAQLAAEVPPPVALDTVAA